jgi:mycothiol system anti-sigma-R factor
MGDDIDSAGGIGDTTGELDCRAVIRELFTFLDGEMAATKTVEFTHHLHGCIDCHEAVAFHAELKTMISAKCREQVPESLKARIAQTLGLEYPPRPRGLGGA